MRAIAREDEDEDAGLLRSGGGGAFPLPGLGQFGAGGFAAADAPLPELSISGDQLLQHGTVLRKSGWVLGLAIYTGPDTKMSQNKAPPPTKVSVADRLINRVVVAIFSTQLCIVAALGLAGFLWAGNANPAVWYLGWPSSSVGSSNG